MPKIAHGLGWLISTNCSVLTMLNTLGFTLDDKAIVLLKQYKSSHRNKVTREELVG